MHEDHPLRIFFISGLITLAVLVAVLAGIGWAALLVTLILVVIEVTFSFDNAIVNARILNGMSRFWQQMFLTIGVLIAVFGMRIIFPIIIVMFGTGLGWGSVVDLALHDHDGYAAVLLEAHNAIAAFGGMFLMMLSLHFLFDKSRDTHWFTPLELGLQKFARWWVPLLICAVALTAISLTVKEHALEVAVAGAVGIVTYGIIHGISIFFEKRFEASEATASAIKKTGMAGFVAFLYLQVLDSSFSLDGVIGAFAITHDVILIAAGLGIGALWVRSLTVYMVRRNVLENYRYLEHGAYYTIGILSLMLVTSMFVEIPQVITGTVSASIIIMAVISSIRARRLAEA